jgi:nicotinamidase-related amidase
MSAPGRGHEGRAKGRIRPGTEAALLLIDVISDFRFEDGAALAQHAEAAVAAIAALRGRFRQAGRPVIYVNDNFGRWTATFPDLVDWASRGDSRGRAIVDALLPQPDDLFILKPRHSAFFETALPTLLDALGVHEVAIAGVAGDACVLASAMDAHIRKLDVWVPEDGVASVSRERNERAIAHMAESLRLDVRPIHGLAD